MSERENFGGGIDESDEGRGWSSCRRLVAEDEVVVALWMEEELVERVRDVMAAGFTLG